MRGLVGMDGPDRRSSSNCLGGPHRGEAPGMEVERVTLAHLRRLRKDSLLLGCKTKRPVGPMLGPYMNNTDYLVPQNDRALLLGAVNRTGNREAASISKLT